ncbi:MAG TPA: response regulator [Segetibacter sp.]|jgi:CheY-like chemotaxis protein
MKQLTLSPILLIDDDLDDLEVFTDAFTSLEIENEVVAFSNAFDALEYLKQSGCQPLFILCDINMPKLNGLQFRQELYKDEVLRQQSIPFLFLSTANDPVFIDRAYDLSVQGYFKKPEQVKEIKEMFLAIINYWRYSHHPNSSK